MYDILRLQTSFLFRELAEASACSEAAARAVDMLGGHIPSAEYTFYTALTLLALCDGATPEERNGRIRGVYPWGYDWPPPNSADNLADINSARKASLDSAIAGYEDKFPFLAPVAALPANERGVCGLGGNVSEWVETDFEAGPPSKPGEAAKSTLGTVRGGNWRTAAPEELLSSARRPEPPETRRNTIGFRVVLARGK